MNNAKDKTIFIVGHKNPDTDSIVSAIAYAEYLKKKGKKAVAVRTGQINPETKFVLEHFRVKVPAALTDASQKQIILLDHNERTQSPDGIEKAEILEVIDHHKVNFQSEKPILFHSEPVGSTSTLIARRYLSDKKTKIPQKIAGILLSGILSDTVVFRSPTTVKEDIGTAKKLAEIAGIKNLEKFGIEIKKKKAAFGDLDAKAIIYSDFKDFNLSGKKVGMGQIEVCDFKEVDERKKELIDALKEICQKGNYNLLILIATDIIKIGSQILAWGQTDYLEKAFGKKVKDNSLYLPGVMSRKAEILPLLTKAFKS